MQTRQSMQLFHQFFQRFFRFLCDIHCGIFFLFLVFGLLFLRLEVQLWLKILGYTSGMIFKRAVPCTQIGGTIGAQFDHQLCNGSGLNGISGSIHGTEHKPDGMDSFKEQQRYTACRFIAHHICIQKQLQNADERITNAVYGNLVLL